MSGYWVAGVVGGVAVLVMGALGVWAARLVGRFQRVAAAYRRHLAAESALLEHRRAGLVTELARRRGRTPRG